MDVTILQKNRMDINPKSKKKTQQPQNKQTKQTNKKTLYTLYIDLHVIVTEMRSCVELQSEGN